MSKSQAELLSGRPGLNTGSDRLNAWTDDGLRITSDDKDPTETQRHR